MENLDGSDGQGTSVDDGYPKGFRNDVTTSERWVSGHPVGQGDHTYGYGTGEGLGIKVSKESETV